jgi:hypothetical protein
LTRETISPIRIQTRCARQEVSVFGFEGGIGGKLDRERGISVPRTGSVAGVQERVEKGNILQDMRMIISSHCIVNPPDFSPRQYQNSSLSNSNMDPGKGLQGEGVSRVSVRLILSRTLNFPHKNCKKKILTVGDIASQSRARKKKKKEDMIRLGLDPRTFSV